MFQDIKSRMTEPEVREIISYAALDGSGAGVDKEVAKYPCVLPIQPERAKMRRADRAITNRAEILDIISRADTVRLGINGAPYPYVVPLSYGFEVQSDRGGEIWLYVHGAKDGFKHELLAWNNRVCAEFDIFHRYTLTETSVTTEYESVIGFGKAVLIGGNETIKGLGLILKHCGFEGFEYDHTVADVVSVLRIELYEVTGKRRFVE